MLGIDVKAAKYAWTVFLIALGLYLIYRLGGVLLILVFAVFFAYLLLPLVDAVDRRVSTRIPRTASLGIVFLTVFGLLIAALLTFGGQIGDEAARLSEQLPALLDPANLTKRIPLPHLLEPQRDRIAAYLSTQVRSNSGQALPLAQRFGKVALETASSLLYLVIVPILSFLLLKEGPRLKSGFVAWSGRTKNHYWTSIVDELNVLLASYVRALILLSTAAFVIYGAFLSAISVPFALLLAGVAALLEVIPVVGPLIGAIAIIGTCVISGFDQTLWVVLFIVGYRCFQDYVLAPYLMGRGVEISPLLVILGLLAGEKLAGVAGIFLSVPVIAAAKIVLTHVVREATQAVPSPVSAGVTVEDTAP